MAYGAKYVVQFSDVYQDTTAQYIATIYKKDYTGGTVELTCSETPLTIETDRSGNSSYRPIISSVARLNLRFNESGLYKTWEDIDDTWDGVTGKWEDVRLFFDITEFLTADLDTFYIVIRKNGNIRWKGYYITTSDVYITEIFPLDFSISFSDVSLMKSTEIFDATEDRLIGFNADDKISLLDLILDSVYSAGLDYEVRINFPYTKTVPNFTISDEGVISDGTISVEGMYILKNALLKTPGAYLNYFDILLGVCSQFGLVAYQKQGIFYIVSYDQLINESSRVYKRYASSGKTYIADITETDSPIEIGSLGFKQINRSQQIRFSLPYKYLDISSDTSKSSNTFNAYLWGFDSSTGTLQPSGLKRVGSSLPFPTSKAIYKTSATPPYNYHFGLKIPTSIVALDYNIYWETRPINVSQGDVISASAYWANDAGVVAANPSAVVNTFAFVTLKYNDNDGTTRYLYTLKNTMSDVIIWNSIIPSAPLTPVANFKNVEVPFSGEITVRLLRGQASTPTAAAYLEHMFVQVYKGEQIDSVPSNTTSRSFYNNRVNNKDTQVLNAIPYFFYSRRYTETGTDSTNKANAGVVSNAIVTKWNQFVDDDFVLGGPPTIQYNVGQAIQRNIGLLNTTIEGAYKSDFYDVSQKFTYTITGLPSKTFCLLDYKFDLKSSEQDSILYSCEFTDTSGLDFTITRIENF